MANNELGLVFFPAFDWAISQTHPERQERLLYTRDQLLEEGVLDLPQIREYRPGLADWADLERVHIGVPGLDKLVKDAHRVAAGGAIEAANAVLSGEVKRAFALLRPPGHHAMRVVHGTRGFCTVNMEAIMVEHLRRHRGVGRVAIVDTDVHHGDGTQDIYYHDPDTLFISFHQDGRTLYPGSGFADEEGGPAAFGSTLNIPLPPGTGDEGLHRVLDELVLPVLADFKPDLIVNSAGQDNHYSDPLANMAVTAQGYARLADKLKADVAVLEGGYSIEGALPYVNLGILLAMAGLDYDRVIEPDIARCPRQSADVTAKIDALIGERLKSWKTREERKKLELTRWGDEWQRQRGIYYDDSGIEEEQRETLRICPKCSGWLGIDSRARGNFGRRSAYAAIVPRDACPRCRQQAYDAARAARQAGRHNYYYVQDRQADCLERIGGHS